MAESPIKKSRLRVEKFRKDPETGFLVNTQKWVDRGFNAEKKTKFIQALYENPSLGYACKQARVDFTTFRNHFLADDVFKAAVNKGLAESAQYHKGDIEQTMLDRAKSANGFMDRMAWLRRHFPNEYNETKRVEHNIHASIASKIESLPQTLDVELLPPEQIETDNHG